MTLLLIEAGADIEIQTSGQRAFLEQVAEAVETHKDSEGELGEQARKIKTVLKDRGFDTEQIYSLESQWKEKLKGLKPADFTTLWAKRYGVYRPGVNKPRKYVPPTIEDATPFSHE